MHLSQKQIAYLIMSKRKPQTLARFSVRKEVKKFLNPKSLASLLAISVLLSTLALPAGAGVSSSILLTMTEEQEQNQAAEKRSPNDLYSTEEIANNPLYKEVLKQQQQNALENAATESSSQPPGETTTTLPPNTVTSSSILSSPAVTSFPSPTLSKSDNS